MFGCLTGKAMMAFSGYADGDKDNGSAQNNIFILSVFPVLKKIG